MMFNVPPICKNCGKIYIHPHCGLCEPSMSGKYTKAEAEELLENMDIDAIITNNRLCTCTKRD